MVAHWGTTYSYRDVVIARGEDVNTGPRLTSEDVDAIVLIEWDGGMCGGTPIVAAHTNGDVKITRLDVDCHFNTWTVRTGADRIEFEMRASDADEASQPLRRIFLLGHSGLHDEKLLRFIESQKKK